MDPIVAVDGSAPLGSFALAGFAGLQAPLYHGPTGYRAGARSQAGIALSRPFDAVTLRLSAEVLHEQPDRWDGRVPTADGNQGRTDVYAAPGVTWNFAGEWMLSADVQFRAYSHVVNAQLDMPVVLEMSVGRLFHLERGVDERDKAPPSAADVLDVVQAGELADLTPAPGKWPVFAFWAPWCEAWNPLDARLRRLAEERPSLALRRIDIVDFDSPIAQRELEGVTQLPHLRILRPGGGVAYESSGSVDELFAEAERLTR